MSSRNVRLSSEERKAAPIIFEVLQKSRTYLSNWSLPESKCHMIEIIESSGHLAVEYLEFADATTLQPIVSKSSLENGRVFLAAKTSTTRLIDNMKI
jgi:pantoate--beta-alanine ligase